MLPYEDALHQSGSAKIVSAPCESYVLCWWPFACCTQSVEWWPLLNVHSFVIVDAASFSHALTFTLTVYILLTARLQAALVIIC